MNSPTIAISKRLENTIAVLAVCHSLTACAADRDDAWAGSTETFPNGAIRVLNPEAGLWTESDRWRLVEDLRIGSVEGAGPDVFGSMFALSLAVDADGRMYVLDGQANEIRVFDASGAHVRSFGRAGSGPGEMRSPALAGWSPDGNLWVADAANARYSAFSTAGEFVTSVRREISFSMSPWPGTIDTTGRIFDIGIRRDERSERALVRVDPTNATADTFPLPSHEGGAFHLLNAAGLPMRSVTIPFAGRLIWKLDPRGFVWSSITDRYRIVQQSLAGDTLQIIERAQRPIPVTSEERAAALEGLQGFIEAGGRIDPSRIPSTKPALNDFITDDRGYLWVSHGRAVDVSQLTYDVFDPTGRYLGEVPATTPLNMWAARPVFAGGYVYGFTRDDMDVPYLVRLRIERRAPAD